MRRKTQRAKIISDMNVVPYIDVMLVLLIIFMVTAPMITQGVNVELPTASSEKVETDNDNLPIIISVDKNGIYYIENEDGSKQSNLEDIIFHINENRKTNKLLKVLLRGDQNVNYGKIIDLMSSLKNNGIPNVGLITKDG